MQLYEATDKPQELVQVATISLNEERQAGKNFSNKIAA